MSNKNTDWTNILIIVVALIAVAFLAFGIYTNYTLGVYK
jgi:uncharacterized protein YoxC